MNVKSELKLKLNKEKISRLAKEQQYQIKGGLIASFPTESCNVGTPSVDWCI